MNDFGRVILCGIISQYNLPPNEQFGHKCMLSVLSKRIKIQGFIVFDKTMGPKYFKEHQENMQKWIAAGDIHVKEHIVEGLENAQKALLGLFKGENFGKVVLKVHSNEPSHKL